MDNKPETARDIIYSLPQRLKKDKVDPEMEATFHFKFEGPTGGDFTAVMKNGDITVQDGLVGDPTCEVKAKATDYEDIELGRTNPQMAFMMGKIKVTNLGEMMKFITLFHRLS